MALPTKPGVGLVHLPTPQSQPLVIERRSTGWRDICGWLGIAAGTAVFVAALAVSRDDPALVVWLITKTGTVWCFTMTESHLIAVHQLARQRLEISWTAICSATKVPLPWRNRGAEAGWTCITLADGREVFFSCMMLRPYQFLDELKARAVNCTTFDPFTVMDFGGHVQCDERRPLHRWRLGVGVAERMQATT